jgi:hypothetical protein
MLLLCGAAMVAGCPDTTNFAVLPITTIQIPIGDLLNGVNLECGGPDAGPDEVYKYAAVVHFDGSDKIISPTDCSLPILAGLVSDCYVPGTLSYLPLPNDAGAVPDGGSFTYSVQIYFFNADTWAKLDNGEKIEAAVKPNATSTICQLPYPYTWMTTCTATEQANVASSAACERVELNPAAAVLDSGVEDSGVGDARSTEASAGDASIPDAKTSADARSHDAQTDARSIDGATDAPPD